MKNYRKWYENKYVKCSVCRERYWRTFSPPHHVFRRNDIRRYKIDLSDERYFIDLCMLHHSEYHFSAKSNGIRFYIKHKILNQVKQHVHDDRFDIWAECAIEKVGLQKEICENT